MPLQFQHVFAGIGMRGRKVQRKPFVQRVAGGIEERGECREPGPQPARRQARRERCE